MQLLSGGCKDDLWCSEILKGTESVHCVLKKAQDDCPLKCHRHLSEDHPCQRGIEKFISTDK